MATTRPSSPYLILPSETMNRRYAPSPTLLLHVAVMFLGAWIGIRSEAAACQSTPATATVEQARAAWDDACAPIRP